LIIACYLTGMIQLGSVSKCQELAKEFPISMLQQALKM
jgi:hypothetical protein